MYVIALSHPPAGPPPLCSDPGHRSQRTSAGALPDDIPLLQALLCDFFSLEWLPLYLSLGAGDFIRCRWQFVK